MPDILARLENISSCDIGTVSGRVDVFALVAGVGVGLGLGFTATPSSFTSWIRGLPPGRVAGLLWGVMRDVRRESYGRAVDDGRMAVIRGGDCHCGGVGPGQQLRDCLPRENLTVSKRRHVQFGDESMLALVLV